MVRATAAGAERTGWAWGIMTKLGSGPKEWLSRQLLVGEVIILALSLVSLLWLHGRLLIFWDSWIPINSTRDAYLMSFSWSQLNGLGSPILPNEYIVYVWFFVIVNKGLGLSLQATQQLLVTLLFASSGLSMYWLLRYLTRRFLGVGTLLAPLSGATFYMFNYYTVHLFSEVFFSWFAYAILPFVALLLLSSRDRAMAGRPYFGHIVLASLLFELMSVAYAQVPYFVLSGFVLLTLIWICGYGRGAACWRTKLLWARFYGVWIAVIGTMNSWWLLNDASSLLPTVAHVGGSGSGTLAVVVRLFSSVGDPYRSWSVVAVYPQLYPQHLNNDWAWVGAFQPGPSIFLAVACIIVVFLFLPLLLRDRWATSFPIARLYTGTLIILFAGLEGLTAAGVAAFEVASALGSEVTALLYATRYPFTEFALVFLYSIAFAIATDQLWNLRLAGRGRALRDNPPSASTGPSPIRQSGAARRDRFSRLLAYKVRVARRRHIRVLVVVLLVLILVIYPFYLWTGQASQQYESASGQSISSLVSLPEYFVNLTSYIAAHAGSAATLVLPETDIFFSLNFSTGNTLMSTGLVGYMTGTSVLQAPTPAYASIARELESLLYDPGITPSNFSTYLSGLNVKYVILNTIFDPSAGPHPFYNISYLREYLGNQTSLVEVGSFGPLELFLNKFYSGSIEVLEPTAFNPTLSSPYGAIRSLIDFRNLTVNFPSLGSFTDNGSVLNLTIESYNPARAPVNFLSMGDLGVNISRYHYLLVTLKSSPGLYVSIYGRTFFTRGASAPTGTTFLAPMNLTTWQLQTPEPSFNYALYQGGSNYTTYAFPLYGQPWYPGFARPSLPVNLTLSNLTFSLRFIPGLSNQSGSLDISNISFAKYVSANDSYIYRATEPNTSRFTALPPNLTVPPTAASNHSGLPVLVSKEENPTKFRLQVANASGPFVILMKQAFDSGWRLISDYGVANVTHFVAEGYANGWLVVGHGDLSFTITYVPQGVYSDVTSFAIGSNLLIILAAALERAGVVRGLKRSLTMRRDRQ